MTTASAIPVRAAAPAATATATPNERYKQLRARLEKLGYVDVFSPDSVDLLQHLLNDLVQTTDSCRTFKQSLDAATQKQRFLEGKLEPLRHEIGQLTRENNQLHMSVVQAADERDERERKTQIALRKYQNDVADLNFLNKQLAARADDEKRKAEAERFRLEHILSLIGASVGKDIDAQYIKNNAKKISSRLMEHVQRIDIDTGLEPMSEQFQPQTALPDPHTVDLLSLADAKMKQLRAESKTNSAKNEDLQNEIGLLREQVTAREQEIARLGSLLESERAHLAVGTENRRVDADIMNGSPPDYGKMSRVEQLESQIEFLHDTVAELEKNVVVLEKERTMAAAQLRQQSAATEKISELQKTNEELSAKLHSVEHSLAEQEKKPRKSAQSVIKLKEQAIQVETEAVNTDKVSSSPSLQQTRERNEQLSREVRQLRQDFLTVTRDLKITKTHLDHILNEHPSIDLQLPTTTARRAVSDDDLVERIVKDNNSLHARVLELEEQTFKMDSQKSELQQLQAERAQLLPDLKRAQSLIVTLEKQAEHHQLEIDRLLQRCEQVDAVRVDLMAQRQSLMDQLAAAKRQIEHLQQQLQEQPLEAKPEKSLKSISDECTATHVPTADAALQTDAIQQDSAMASKNREVEELQRQLNFLREELGNLNSSEVHNDNRQLLIEFDKERDRFQHELDTKTERLVDLEALTVQQTADLAILRSRAAELELQLKQARVQLTNAREECKKLQSDLHSYKAKADSLETECQAATEHAKGLGADISAVLQENQQLQQQLDTLTNSYDQLKHHADAHEQQCAHLRQLVAEKDKENERTMAMYRTAVTEHSQLSEEVKQLKSLHQSDQARVSLKEDEVQKLQTENSHLHQQIAAITANLEMIEHSRADKSVAVARLEQKLDEQQSRNESLTRELESMRAVINQLQSSKEELERMAAQRASDLASGKLALDQRDAEVDSLRQQIDDQTRRLQKFEQLVGEERTKAARSEISVKELKARNESLEQRLHIQTDVSEVALKEELAGYRAENSQLRDKILYIEAGMVQLSELLHNTEADRARLQALLANQTGPPLADTEQQFSAPRADSSQFSAQNVGPQYATEPRANSTTPRQSNLTSKSSPRAIDVSPLAAPTNFDAQLEMHLEETRQHLSKYTAGTLSSSKSGARRPADNNIRTGPVSPRTTANTTAGPVTPGTNANTTAGMTVIDEDDHDDSRMVQITNQVLEGWKQQNDALRRELFTSPLPASIASTVHGTEYSHRTGDRPTTAAYRETESERRRLEDENRFILDIVHMAAEDLKASDANGV